MSQHVPSMRRRRRKAEAQRGGEMATRLPDGTLSNVETMTDMLKDVPDVSPIARALAKTLGLWTEAELDQMFGPERR